MIILIISNACWINIINSNIIQLEVPVMTEESLLFAKVVDYIKCKCAKDVMNVSFYLAELKTL